MEAADDIMLIRSKSDLRIDRHAWSLDFTDG